MKNKGYKWGVTIVFTCLIALCIFSDKPLAEEINDFDVAQGWDVQEYTSDLNIPLDKIFIQNDDSERNIGNGDEKIRRAFMNFANIGNSTFRAVKTLHLEHGVTYKFNWRFGIVTQGKATASVDFNGKTFTTSKEPWDSYAYTITPTADMDYIITMTFNAPKVTNVFMMVGYDVDSKDSKGVEIIKKGQPVTVHYLNENDQKLAASEVIEGNVGESYETKARAISGYKLKKTVGNPKGEFTETGQTVSYIYEPIEDDLKTAGKVTIRYVDEQGTKLAPDKILTGKIDESFQAEIKEIDGYLATKISSSMGTFQTEDQVIEIVYKKKTANQDSNVIVKFLDKNDEEIAKPLILTGQLGTEYKAQPKEIDGYKLVEIPENQTGIFTKNTESVIYKYEKEDASSKEVNKGNVKKIDPSDPSDSSNQGSKENKNNTKKEEITVKPVADKSPAEKQQKKQQLPTTGDESGELFIFIGLILAITGFVTWKKKTRDEKGA